VLGVVQYAHNPKNVNRFVFLSHMVIAQIGSLIMTVIQPINQLKNLLNGGLNIIRRNQMNNTFNNLIIERNALIKCLSSSRLTEEEKKPLGRCADSISDEIEELVKEGKGVVR